MRNFAEEMGTKYQFIKTSYTLYSDSWPKIEVKLTNEQVAKFNSISNNLETLVKRYEIIANEKHFPNAGIIGSTKIDATGNTLIIKGSQAVIELLLEQIFY